jgi:ubiquinone/menaquinone biosynthesis C-methylase UbiE
MDTQEEEIESRNQEAEKFDAWYLGTKGILYDWVEKKSITDALDLKKGDFVLDAGCGTGRITVEIAKRVSKVYALDFAPASIQMLNKKLREQGIENVETHVADITKALPVADQVDKVVSVQVIQHIPSEPARSEAVENLYRQLKPGGACVITVYNYDSFLNRRFAKEGEFEEGVYYFRFNSQEARELLKRSGFDRVSTRGCVNFRGYACLNNHELHRLLSPVARLDAFLSKLTVSRFLGAYLLCRGLK